MPRGPRPASKPRENLPSRSHLILSLRAIAQRLDRTPTTADIIRQSKERGTFSLDFYYYVFGSYLEAVKSAGLKSNYRREIDRGELLWELKELRRALGRPLKVSDVAEARRRGSVSPVSRYMKAFGSISKAIGEADAGAKAFTRVEMIAILRRLDAGIKDRPVLKRDVDELYVKGLAPHFPVFEREFKGFARARRAAGVKNSYRKNATVRSAQWQKFTATELIGQLRALARDLGRKPTDRDINRASKEGRCASAATFARAFGTLPDAYRAAGFEPAKKSRKYTDAEIEEQLRAIARELGRMPTFHELEAASLAGRCPSPGTILRRLGSLAELKARFGCTDG